MNAARSIALWFQEIDPTVALLTPEDWNKRPNCPAPIQSAALIVIHDGGEFSRYHRKHSAWQQFARCYPQAWAEELTGWASAIYIDGTPDEQSPADKIGTSYAYRSANPKA